MTSIKFKHGEKYADIDKATFNSWECGLINTSDAIYLIMQNNEVENITAKEFKAAAEELGYKRGRRKVFNDYGEDY